MRKRTQSFKHQLNLAFVFLATASTTLLAGLILATAVKSINTHYVGMAVDSTNLAARLLSGMSGGNGSVFDEDPEVPNLAQARVAETLANALMAEHVAVFDAKEQMIAFKGPASPDVADVMPELLRAAKSKKDLIIEAKNGIWVGAAVPQSERSPGGWVFTHHTLRESKRLVHNTILYVVSSAAILTAIAFALSFRFSRLFTRPIDALLDGARRFGQGELSHKVEAGGYDEFIRVARAFNDMAGSLKSHMAVVEKEAKHREKLESEMRIASFLQRSLLPANLPESPCFELSALSQPAEDVGGDFYDALRLSDGKLMIAIGDATNKGLPAALHVTECASAFRAYAMQHDSPGRILGHLNNLLSERLGDTCRFVTMFLMVYDERSGHIVYSLAGHNPPVLLHKSHTKTELLTGGRGLPLGLVSDTEYSEGTARLENNDLLLLYTDGITEATNQEGGLLGVDGLVGCLLDGQGEPVDSIVTRIAQVASQHCSPLPQSDDMTLVCLKRNA